jgi:hypothetical protein
LFSLAGVPKAAKAALAPVNRGKCNATAERIPGKI